MNYLEMKNVKKNFGDLEVIKDISLTVRQGEVVAVIRPVRVRKIYPAQMRHTAGEHGRR